MNYELREYVEAQLERFPEQDVLVRCERHGSRFPFGFYVWNGNGHTQTTIVELREAGFEKKDIKELRDSASKLLVIEDVFRNLTVLDGE